MKNIESEVSEILDSSEKISGSFQQVLRGEDVDIETLLSNMSKNSYSRTFIENITDEDKFIKGNLLTQKAFDERNEDQFVLMLQKRNRIKLIKRLTITIGSIASAIALLLLFIDPYFTSVSNIEGTVVAVEKSEYNTPTLTTSEGETIKFSNKTKKVIASNYLNEDKNQVGNEKEIVDIQDNSLNVPSGYTYSILLEDGSEVTLNAKSKITYPSTFSDSTREVYIEGEAFFNVTKSSKPFIVHTKNIDIKVYGTSFNVNARDSAVVSTTLVSGVVGVKGANSKENMLKPNQQAVYNTRNNECLIHDVNVENYIAWKSDYFRFIDASVEMVIMELEAWHGVDMKYNKADFSDVRINISMDKSQSLENKIKQIEYSLNSKIIKKADNKYAIEKL